MNPVSGVRFGLTIGVEPTIPAQEERLPISWLMTYIPRKGPKLSKRIPIIP